MAAERMPVGFRIEALDNWPGKVFAYHDESGFRLLVDLFRVRGQKVDNRKRPTSVDAAMLVSLIVRDTYAESRDHRCAEVAKDRAASAFGGLLAGAEWRTLGPKHPLAVGHRERTGHQLIEAMVPAGDGIYEIFRVCCGILPVRAEALMTTRHHLDTAVDWLIDVAGMETALPDCRYPYREESVQVLSAMMEQNYPNGVHAFTVDADLLNLVGGDWAADGSLVDEYGDPTSTEALQARVGVSA